MLLDDELKQITLLYVEDDITVQHAMKSFFNFKVKKAFTANDGLEGLEVYKANQNEITFIVTDIQMPKMDGIEMISKIKQLNPNIRTIITTAFDDTRYLMKSIELGVNAYLTKPIDLKKLAQVLKEQISIIRYEQNQKLYDSALKLALDLQDSASFAISEDSIISVNAEFLTFFSISSLSKLDEKVEQTLIDGVKNNTTTIKLQDVECGLSIEEDDSKMLKIVSLI